MTSRMAHEVSEPGKRVKSPTVSQCLTYTSLIQGVVDSGSAGHGGTVGLSFKT